MLVVNKPVVRCSSGTHVHQNAHVGEEQVELLWRAKMWRALIIWGRADGAPTGGRVAPECSWYTYIEYTNLYCYTYTKHTIENNTAQHWQHVVWFFRQVYFKSFVINALGWESRNAKVTHTQVLCELNKTYFSQGDRGDSTYRRMMRRDASAGGLRAAKLQAENRYLYCNEIKPARTSRFTGINWKWTTLPSRNIYLYLPTNHQSTSPDSSTFT